MILTHLELRNFRSYESLSLDFDRGLNAIVGENATGKSNLAEAIYFLSLARSWRTTDDNVLIKDRAPGAYVQAQVKEGMLSRKLEIEFSKASKKVSINGKPARRLSELAKSVNVICFAPEDVSLFSRSPGDRRDFLDISLSKQSNDYFSLIGEYARLLKERNALLKMPQIDFNLLDVLTERLADLSEPIVRYRTMYVASINGVLPTVLKKIRGDDASVELVYRPCVRDDGRFREKIRAAFKESLESDLMRKMTLIGPHREDLLLKLNGKDISEYGSQGENRMAVLALKLTPSFLIEDVDKKPICVLDDVTSELDANHVQRLCNLLLDFPQVFLTATNLEIDGASYIDVSMNTATRRK